MVNEYKFIEYTDAQNENIQRGNWESDLCKEVSSFRFVEVSLRTILCCTVFTDRNVQMSLRQQQQQ